MCLASWTPILTLSLALGQNASTDAKPPALLRAEQQLESVKRMVDAGVTARSKLKDAEAAVEAAKDDAILARTLYGELRVQDLSEQQANEMRTAAERQLMRQKARLESASKLVQQGVTPQSGLGDLALEIERASQTVELANQRSHLVLELIEMARMELAQADAAADTPDAPLLVAERFVGVGTLRVDDIKRINLAYARKFSRSLPVTANGETAVHRSMGFDHRGRIDVGLTPDSEEGSWLRRYLENAKIPFLAFRRMIPGQATAPHIHIGPPSNRIKVAD